jgi:hypothetical protein
MASLELCTDRMSGFMGPDKPSSFCNHYIEPPCFMWCFYFWRENEVEGQDFILGAGARFQHSRDLWMVAIRESLRKSSIWHVGQVLPLQGICRFESLWHSRLWVVACRCSHLVVCLVYCWRMRGVGYAYGHDYTAIMIIVFTYLWCWHGSTFCLFMLVLVCRCKHSTRLKKLKWLN